MFLIFQSRYCYFLFLPNFCFRTKDDLCVIIALYYKLNPNATIIALDKNPTEENH